MINDYTGPEPTSTKFSQLLHSIGTSDQTGRKSVSKTVSKFKKTLAHVGGPLNNSHSESPFIKLWKKGGIERSDLDPTLKEVQEKIRELDNLTPDRSIDRNQSPERISFMGSLLHKNPNMKLALQKWIGTQNSQKDGPGSSSGVQNSTDTKVALSFLKTLIPNAPEAPKSCLVFKSLAQSIHHNTENAKKLLHASHKPGEFMIDSIYRNNFKETPNYVTDQQRKELKSYWERPSVNTFWKEMQQDIVMQGKPRHNVAATKEIYRRLEKEYKRDVFKIMYHDGDLDHYEKKLMEKEYLINEDARDVKGQNMTQGESVTLEDGVGEKKVARKSSKPKIEFHTYVSENMEAQFVSFSLLGGKGLEY